MNDELSKILTSEQEKNLHEDIRKADHFYKIGANKLASEFYMKAGFVLPVEHPLRQTLRQKSFELREYNGLVSF